MSSEGVRRLDDLLAKLNAAPQQQEIFTQMLNDSLPSIIGREEWTASAHLFHAAHRNRSLIAFRPRLPRLNIIGVITAVAPPSENLGYMPRPSDGA